MVCWVEVNTSTSSSETMHKKGLGVTHILCSTLFLFLFMMQVRKHKQWNWKAAFLHRPQNRTGGGGVFTLRHEANSRLKIYFFFSSHIKTVEAPQTHACRQFFVEMTEALLQNLRIFFFLLFFASDTQSWTQVLRFPSAVRWKICRRKSCSRRMGASGTARWRVVLAFP